MPTAARRALRCQLPGALPLARTAPHALSLFPRPTWRSAQTRLFVSAGAQEEAEAETMPGKLKVKIVAGRHLPVMDRASDLTDAFVEVGARSCFSNTGSAKPYEGSYPTRPHPIPLPTVLSAFLVQASLEGSQKADCRDFSPFVGCTACRRPPHTARRR